MKLVVKLVLVIRKQANVRCGLKVKESWLEIRKSCFEVRAAIQRQKFVTASRNW